ncbi:MAG: hypothetical protein EPO09_21210, partial [Aquabacterium sp.]|uniref:hypothetical protein n=1 Tax=Aquabacterium sp. TaxID=1872578 RepID=UPI0011FFF175
MDKITGVATAKTASSLTDIWFVTFKNGVIYDGQPATRAVLKIWINDWRYTSGLEYERRIYAEVIEAMLTARMSPCFVRCYASSSGCSQNSLLEILTAGMKNVTPDKIRYAWMRNLTALKSALPRPAIDDVSAKIKREGRLKEVPPSTTDTCGMIMTESMQGERTFHQFLNAGVIAPGGNSTFTDAMWRVLIQIATACYAMSYTKLTHYDLHANNIFVKNVPSSERRTVVQYAGELMLTYNNLDLVPKVYDFDNSYAHSLGTNIALTDRFGVCKWYGRCNLNIDNIDIMKVLCGVYKACDGLPVLQDIIADACCISSDSKSLMKDLFKTQYCWFVKGSGFNIEAYPESTWSKFRSSRDILYALARAAPASALNVKFDAVGQAPAAGADVYSVPPVRGMVRRAQSPVRRAPSPVRRAPSP